MDLDAYVARSPRGVGTSRLPDEQAPARRRARATSSSSATSGSRTHLSVIRTAAPDATVISYLSLAAQPGAQPLGRTRRPAPGTASVTFVVERFPAALYRLRWWWIGTAAANVVDVFVMMWWLLDHPDVEQTLLTPRDVDHLVNHEFAGYYSTYAASHFAAEVWINNAWVTALLPRPRRARAAGRVPALPERRQPRDHRLDHDPARARAGVLGVDPAARHCSS